MSDKRIIISDPITQDRLFPVTLADSVYYADGTPLQHTHDLSSMNGVLPISKGGTGVTTLDELRKLIGTGSSANTAPGGTTDYTGIIDGVIALGGIVTMANIDWTVVHIDPSGGAFYMAKSYIDENIQFGENNKYRNSIILSKCNELLNSLPKNVQDKLLAVDIFGVPSKVFIAKASQITATEDGQTRANNNKGIFDYFTNKGARLAYTKNGDKTNWWTSSYWSADSVWFVDTLGNLNHREPTYTFGFRPFVALKL